VCVNLQPQSVCMTLGTYTTNALTEGLNFLPALCVLSSSLFCFERAGRRHTITLAEGVDKSFRSKDGNVVIYMLSSFF